MAVYSSLVFLVLVGGAPWWLARMALSGRYRAGLGGRLGLVPAALGQGHVPGARGVVWLHAVSVGEVLAATALVGAMRAAGFDVAVSTTTQAGQELARRRFAGCAVFYMPVDLGFIVRRYLWVLKPRLMVTMESELWPNVIDECRKARIPLAVVNARVSDRSFPRYIKLKRVWAPLLRQVSLFLAQSQETASRLLAMGVGADRVRVTGNLKYDVKASAENRMAGLIRRLAAGRPVLVAGSTLGGKTDKDPSEEEMVIQAWEGELRRAGVLLVLAPRHTDRFGEVEAAANEFAMRTANGLLLSEEETLPFAEVAKDGAPGERKAIEIVVLDTIGDLAAVYGVADVAVVGGSLVARGGHNPLEPAQFGVPVVMGESFENFREIVGSMRKADAIRIVRRAELQVTLTGLLREPDAARELGGRGRRVFEAQAGATGRTLEALLGLMEAGV